jgi:alanyl-tRNA synthetase
MSIRSSAEIRRAFLEFFRERDHEIVASAPLVPGNDPTLLFTNAGMVPFKEVFLGTDKRSYSRATSSQRCVRAGGKHNDLDQVGYTARHHTFFEMLGNFSFGDYFKRDAIVYAWDFLTKVLGLPADKLWVTVFEEDDEAEAIWRDEIGVAPDRISRIGAKDNFWSMGDTGPCGPCTEIFYDHGPEVAGGPPGTPEEDGDRYIEIWNLVFMQFNRDESGELTPLPKPCVDTGMGLERLAAILQNVHNNYDIDILQHLIKAAAKLASTDDLSNQSLRVLADHIRACSFLLVDGVMPGREGRGYVLRRIIRRAIRHGHKLGIKDVFFHQLVEPLIEVMGEAYPELVERREHVERMLVQEEQRFRDTLDKGMGLLEEAIAELDGKQLAGDVAFTLYDTHGFPLDLTADILRERGLSVDEAGFEKAMAEQRERAQQASRFAWKDEDIELDESVPATQFLGYEQLSSEAKVLAVVNLGEENQADQVVVLDQTPFYAESGGQVGDCGRIRADGAELEVIDTRKLPGGRHGHWVKRVSGSIVEGEQVEAVVDGERRQAVVLNHSATHLMHAALREVLGEHVQQKGSLVAPDRLRFDFSHYEPVTPEQLATIERRVNAEIRANHAREADEMSYDAAMERGALAFFGDKYGERVRVVQFGPFSTELCGGTHVDRVGDIGLFKVISESGVASGVRRVEAVTGEVALQHVSEEERLVRDIARSLKTRPDEVDDKLRQLLERQRQMERELEALKGKLASSQSGDLASEAVDVQGVRVLARQIEGGDAKGLRNMMDQLRNKMDNAAIVLAAVDGEKVALVAGVSKSLTDRLHAGQLLNHVASKVGGKGGGRPDMAQGGGSQPEQLATALDGVSVWVKEALNKTTA